METLGTDEIIVERALSGDADAFGEIVRRWERRIFALTYGMLGREEPVEPARDAEIAGQPLNLRLDGRAIEDEHIGHVHRIGHAVMGVIERADRMGQRVNGAEAFLEDLPRLRQKVTVPIAAGEEWGHRWDFNKLVENHDIDYVRATLPNVGGITEMVKIMALCETSAVGIVPHFTGPVSTAALVHTMGTFSGPVLMEYNYGNQPPVYLPEFLTFKNGKLYPNDRPGLGVTLLRCRLVTGRTHQIRVHLAASGLPIVGDPVYGRARYPRVAEGELRKRLLEYDEDPVRGAQLRRTQSATFPRCSRSELALESVPADSTKTRWAAPAAAPCSTSRPSWSSTISRPDSEVRMSNAPK